jgi:tetratricopeptide (TPR) repeat protein
MRDKEGDSMGENSRYTGSIRSIATVNTSQKRTGPVEALPKVNGEDPAEARGAFRRRSAGRRSGRLFLCACVVALAGLVAGCLLCILAEFAVAEGSQGGPTEGTAAALHAEALKLYREGRYSDAIEVWERELAIAPGNAVVVNDIGIAYRQLGQLSAALVYHKRAVEIDPRLGPGHYSLGLAQHDLGYYEAAAESFRAAIDLGHRSAVSNFNLGLALSKLGEHAASETAFQRALSEGYTPAKCFFGLATAYRAQRDHDKAIRNLEKALAAEPSLPSANYYLGLSYAALGKYSKARTAFRKEDELGSDWQAAARDEDARLEPHLWFWTYLKDMGLIVARLTWIAWAFAVPGLFLLLMKKRGPFLRPTRVKATLLYALLLMAPSPWILGFVIGFVPAIPMFIMMSETAVRVIGWLKPVALMILLAYYVILVFLGHLFACLLCRILRGPVLVGGLVGLLLALSFFNIYLVGYAGGKGGSANVIKVYSGLGTHIYDIAAGKAPGMGI